MNRLRKVQETLFNALQAHVCLFSNNFEAVWLIKKGIGNETIELTLHHTFENRVKKSYEEVF